MELYIDYLIHHSYDFFNRFFIETQLYSLLAQIIESMIIIE
jgi:hypothetical protein